MCCPVIAPPVSVLDTNTCYCCCCCCHGVQLQDGNFLITKRSFERQYAQLYFSRLMLLQPLMVQQVQQAWPNTRGGCVCARLKQC